MLRAPIVIDGRKVAIVGSRLHPGPSPRSTDMLLVLAEGRQRIVRRICELLELKVEKLTRLSYGPVQLGRLPKGEWRYLTTQERRALGKLGVSQSSEVR